MSEAISGYVRKAGGGVITVVVDRDTESYPDIGTPVTMVERTDVPWKFNKHNAEAQQIADIGARARADDPQQQIAYLEGRNQTLIAQVNDVTRQRDELLTAVQEMGDRVEGALEIVNEPLLGLATTEMLFQELITRFKLEWMSSDTSVLSNVDRCIGLAVMLGGLSANEREYRTVERG